MTIHEAGVYLYQWFSENDCYNPDEDYNKLVLISETPNEDKAAIQCSLDSFEEASIIKKKKVDEGEYWVLQRKFATIEQNVPISAKTALSTCEYVRMYVEVAGSEGEYECDPSNITEKDICILLNAIKILSK